MPGRKLDYDVTHLTPRAVYRAGVSAVDADHTDAELPDIRLDADLGSGVSRGRSDVFAASRTQYNARLELYVFLNVGETASCDNGMPQLVSGVIQPSDQRCHATLQLWAYVAPQDGTELDGKWCLTHEQSVLTDTAIRLSNLPASRYRVTVAAISADCSVDILEQHTI